MTCVNDRRRRGAAVDHLLDGGDLLAVSELFQDRNMSFNLVYECGVLFTLELGQRFLCSKFSHG